MTNIRTKIIQGKQTILLVDLGKKLEEMTMDDYFELGQIAVSKDSEWNELSNGDDLTTIETIAEEQADGLVDKQASDIKIYLNYNTMKFAIGLTAIKSFQSLLNANEVLMENPYNEPWRDDAYPPLWQEAEAKVFKSSTTLIFVKDS